jgi:Anti-sigma factor NepR
MLQPSEHTCAAGRNKYAVSVRPFLRCTTPCVQSNLRLNETKVASARRELIARKSVAVKLYCGLNFGNPQCSVSNRCGHDDHVRNNSHDDCVRSDSRRPNLHAVRKAEGHLSHEDQRRIGDILQRLYDEVILEDVPDRFKNLLDQFEKQGQVKEHQEPDRLGGAKAFDKGSRS